MKIRQLGCIMCLTNYRQHMHIYAFLGVSFPTSFQALIEQIPLALSVYSEGVERYQGVYIAYGEEMALDRKASWSVRYCKNSPNSRDSTYFFPRLYSFKSTDVSVYFGRVRIYYRKVQIRIQSEPGFSK